MNLRIPGPTPLPPEIMAAMQKEMIDHRGPEFAALGKRIIASLKDICQTSGDVLLFTCSGTGGLEAAVVNTLSPGDRVVAFAAGWFGDRLAAIAEAYGAQVEKVVFPQGARIEPAQVTETLRGQKNVKAVLVTHNETSTGVLHPLKAIAEAVRAETDAVLIVDAVSSFLATEIAMDAWGIDVLVTGSQKALMCPPGVAMVAVGKRAWDAHQHAKMPRFYFDFAENKQWGDLGQTAYTPAMSVYFAMDAALELIQREGVDNVYARHARVADLTRELASEIGYELFPQPRDSSPTVTALKVPAGLDGEEIRRIAREEFDTILGGAQGNLKGKLIRIGHLGFAHEPEIQAAMDVLHQATQRARERAKA
jgi:aspartate aminotransferase-like enzyme